MAAKISRKQLYVAAKTIDNNSHVLEGATMRSYDPDFSDESIAELIDTTVPIIRRLRIDIFGSFVAEKRETAAEKVARLEATIAQQAEALKLANQAHDPSPVA